MCDIFLSFFFSKYLKQVFSFISWSAAKWQSESKHVTTSPLKKVDWAPRWSDGNQCFHVECQTNKCNHSPSAFFIHHTNSFLLQLPQWKIKNVTILNNTRNIASLYLTVRRKTENEIQQVIKLIILQAWKFLSHKQRHYEDLKTYAARSHARIVLHRFSNRFPRLLATTSVSAMDTYSVQKLSCHIMTKSNLCKVPADSIIYNRSSNNPPWIIQRKQGGLIS